jgi:TonB family protein
MTSIKKVAVAIGIITSLLSLSVYAQTPRPGLNHFSTDGISFDYPIGYSVTDESTAEAQQFVITRKGSSVQLTIVALRQMVQQNELPAAIEDFKEPIIKKIGITFGQANSAGRIPIESEVGPMQAEGVRLQSLGTGKRTADVIWLRWNFRLLALTFVRPAMYEAVESRLWETVRSSLRVEAPVVIGTKTDGVGPTEGAITGGVLNGKALALPRPEYPAIARAAHASGTVAVQVLIDEKGNVVSAHAVSGHPLLQAASVAAARAAKFSPTLLEGHPVKVTGVIQYNFVAR